MVTIGLIISTAIISFYCFSNKKIFEKLYFTPYRIAHNSFYEGYRFLSATFVHADMGHLIFNMLTLYFFGSEIEKYLMSSREFLFFYLSSAIVASLPTYLKQKNNPNYSAVGASGAVSAVMFVLVLYNPWSLIYLTFFIPLYFILYAVAYLIYSSYQSKYGKDNVAHDVHFYGALYGLGYTLFVHPESLKIFIEAIQQPPFLR